MYQKFKKCLPVLSGVGVMSLISAVSASAAVDLSSVTIDSTTPETLAATVLAGLGVIWGIRKLIKLINRS